MLATGLGQYQLYRALWRGLDLLFPPACVGCNALGFRWCDGCLEKVERPREPLCGSCGLPQPGGSLCPSCSTDRPSFRALRGWALYEGSARLALQRLKYRNDIALAMTLAEQMAPWLRAERWPVQVVVPMPLAKSRLRQRGYNQAGLIAWPLAVMLEMHYEPGSLRRVRDTRSQVGLNLHERRENVQGAFRATASAISGKIVLLVDDVATTGSTLSSAARALLSAGARRVYAATAARALPELSLQHA